MVYKEYVLLGKKDGPKVAIVGCVHGNEPIGKFVIEALKTQKIKNGTLSLILANSFALKKQKRFLKKDLNRSFPGDKHGEYEERLAYYLRKRVKKFDYVLDIHGSKTDCGSLAVVTKLNDKIKDFINLIPVSNILFLKSSVYGKVSLVNYCKTGIALEYGPDKSGKNYKIALGHLREVLRHLNMIDGKAKVFNKKRLLFTAKKKYIFDKFVDTSHQDLRDYKFIKKGDKVGEYKNKPIHSTHSFYPIFLQKGKTKNFALMASKKEYTG